MEHSDAVRRFSAIISAGGQAGEDLASLLGVREKCAAVYHGAPLAKWAVEAALGASAEEVVVVCGDEVREALAGSSCRFAPPGANPVQSARNGLSAVPEGTDIVFIPGDLPLIRSQHVIDFVAALPRSEGNWLATGLASQESIEARFGALSGIGYVKLDRVKYAAASLSAANRGGFLNALDLLSKFSENRKSQLRMAMQFGVADILRLFTGRMTTDRAQLAGERLFGSTCYVVRTCAAELVMDVDTPQDWYALPRAS